MWYSRLLRPVKMIFASLWAGAMIIIGLQLLGLDNSGGPLILSFAIFTIAGGQFIFIFLVADELCPEAPMLIKGTAELVTAAGALVGLVWWIWTWINL